VICYLETAEFGRRAARTGTARRSQLRRQPRRGVRPLSDAALLCLRRACAAVIGKKLVLSSTSAVPILPRVSSLSADKSHRIMLTILTGSGAWRAEVETRTAAAGK
jgi:hypothetical protein